jgi:hypothetical protein
MTPAHTIRRALGTLCAATAAIGLTASPALAATTATTAEAGCSTPVLYQPFTALKDRNFYMPAPGGAFDDPAGAGWQLSGGARIVETTQPDGTVAGVLDLPSRATAVSPSMCITSDYPTARLWVRNLVGSEGVFFYVSYATNGIWTNPKNTGQFHGEHTVWTPSKPMNVQPSKAPGWQRVRFTFVAGGNTSRFQVNDFWVDPRMRA